MRFYAFNRGFSPYLIGNSGRKRIKTHFCWGNCLLLHKMNQLAITNGVIHTGRDTLFNKVLIIEGNRIQAIVDVDEVQDDMEVYDARGWHIAPGFIDLQIYGGGGVLFAEKPETESLAIMAEALVQSGTTGFLLTLATNTTDIFDKAVEVAKSYQHPAFMGLHFEGPYLHPDKRGAHPTSCLRIPNHSELTELLENAEGTIRMMTIAPELFDAELIKLLTDQGVLLSAGHSNASFEESSRGFKQGIRAVTHLFNAMSGLHHRQTGLPGATFLTEDVHASIIADGIHVSYEALAMSKKILGERLFLITDAVEESSSGTYSHQRRGDHFALPDGTLSGSALTQMQAVANCVRHAGISLDEALRMASLYPARLFGAIDQGSLESGKRANITIFDHDYQVKQVFLDGKEQL